MDKRKHTELTLGEKLELCEHYKKSKSMRVTSQNFGVALSTVSNIEKSEENLQKMLEQGANVDNKRSVNLKFDNVDRCCWEWVCEMRTIHLPISGTMLRENANELVIETVGDG